MKTWPFRVAPSGCPWTVTARLVGIVAVVTLLALAATPASANNILPSAIVGSPSVTGTAGVLRSGSIWATTALAPETTLFDGLFLGEGDAWNESSFWWDDHPTVNPSPLTITIQLDKVYTLYGLTIQADNNESYRAEWWDGSAWQVAWEAPPVWTGFGLRTRSSGTLPGIMTDQLRFSASGGDGYYAISEIQASNVPEPTTLALLGAGLVAARARLRRRA